MYTGSAFKHLHLLASRIIPIYISLIIHFSSVKFFFCEQRTGDYKRDQHTRWGIRYNNK